MSTYEQRHINAGKAGKPPPPKPGTKKARAHAIGQAIARDDQVPKPKG